MLGEDGSDPYIQGLEDVQETAVGSQKVLENGQVVIIREGVKYNVLGGRIY